mgnify:CR=1 FL=1
MLAFTIVFLGTGVLFAQKGVVVTQKMMAVENEALHVLMANKELSDPMQIAEFLFDVPLERIAAAQQKHDSEGGAFDMTMYLQEQKVRMDMQSPMGKMSAIIREDEDKMYNVMWAQKKYMEMSLEHIRQMRKGVMQNMPEMQNMPDISQMLDKLPPEAREKALEAMKKSGQMQHMQGQHDSKKSQQSAEKSGRKRQINGFACEEWIVRDGNEISSYWVTHSRPELAKRVQEYSKTLSQGMGMREDDASAGKEIWELVPGSFPVESRTFKQRHRGDIALDIMVVENIEEKVLDGKTFEVPEGFEPGSMFDMMNMNPGKKDRY